VATTLTVLVFGLGLFAAIAPPTANDALMYHLALPKAFIGRGALGEVPYNMASYFPLGVEMHAVWAMLLSRFGSARMGEVAAGATLAAFGPLVVLVTYGWARARRLDRTWSTLAALAVGSIPSVYFVIAGQGVDVAVAGYSALAVLAAGRWWATLESEWLRLIAVAVGMALSAKLSAIAVIVPLTVAVLLRGVLIERAGRSAGGPSAGATVTMGLGGLGVGILLASPWYIRTWIWTGSPLFPLYSTLWPGHAPGWDVGRAELLDALLQVYGRSSRSRSCHDTTKESSGRPFSSERRSWSGHSAGDTSTSTCAWPPWSQAECSFCGSWGARWSAIFWLRCRPWPSRSPPRPPPPPRIGARAPGSCSAGCFSPRPWRTHWS
jgi:hypothetical protein